MGVAHGEELPEWGPVGASRSATWHLAMTHDGFTLSTPTGVESFSGRESAQLSVSPWWFGRSLVVRGPQAGRYRGLSAQDARSIRSAIHRQAARADVAPALERFRVFSSELERLVTHHRGQRLWILHDRLAVVLNCDLQWLSSTSPGSWRRRVFSLATSAKRSPCWIRTLEIVRTANEQIVTDELAYRRDFFDRVESRPLTEEQARSVVTFDTRLRVIAAAGSGKTSVMVARTSTTNNTFPGEGSRV